MIAEELALAKIEDKYIQCQMRNMLSCSAFLDVETAALAEKKFANTKHVLYGGYDDAERRVMIFLPDYYDELPAEDDPLAVLHITVPKGSRRLNHRDYLGSILALGIDRSLVGDILVRDDGADILVLKNMADYFLTNYDKAANVTLKAELLAVSELTFKPSVLSEVKDTVASLRLDNLVSSAFHLSRTKAQEAVKGGIVFVNGLQCIKPDYMMSEGDKLVLRGSGKAVLSEIGKTTKKDRIFITLSVYK